MNFNTTIKLFFIVCSFLILSCKTSKSTPKLKYVFNEQELEDVQILRDFFVNDILELTDEDFYYGFKLKIRELEASGYNTVKREQINELLNNSISNATFNQIWDFKTEKRNRNSLGTYDYLIPKKEGKYLRFLDRNTKYNSKIKDYYNEILSSGEFSHSSMLNYINSNTIDFDLHNLDIQIVLAIHYISICRDNSSETTSLYDGR